MKVLALLFFATLGSQRGIGGSDNHLEEFSGNDALEYESIFHSSAGYRSNYLDVEFTVDVSKWEDESTDAFYSGDNGDVKKVSIFSWSNPSLQNEACSSIGNIELGWGKGLYDDTTDDLL